jgi:branched-subunit amino acid aminotransferase/4-amino-4-deoxychorismate lyase
VRREPFIVRHGRIKTPPIATVLEGITRDTAIALLRHAGKDVVEERFTRDEVYIADEAFLYGQRREITPIRSLDDREIGAGAPVRSPRSSRGDTSTSSRQAARVLLLADVSLKSHRDERI